MDEDPKNPWCTHANTEIGAVLKPHECTALKCIIERPLDTGDDLKDLKFTPTEAAVDHINIRQGRALLYINKDEDQFSYAAMYEKQEVLQIDVPLFATSLFA